MDGHPEIVGSSVPMRELRNLIERVAPSEVPVLITGESGVGKELVARALHAGSKRKERPFVEVNCSALPEGILESELFGHARGSFTGAVRDRAGLFEQAHGGTIFLDEIGEMPIGMQAKLLRVLQNRSVRRMGEGTVRGVDFRLIAATNIDLERRVEEGIFRRDLYFRINVIELRVPPLRERRSDLFELIAHFYRRRGLEVPDVPENVSRVLGAYRWPGNVRELENEVERLIALNGAHDRLSLEMLSPRIRNHMDVAAELDFDLLCEGPLAQAVRSLEQEILLRRLRRTNWNRSKAARELGISRQGLLKKLRRYGLEKKGSRQAGRVRKEKEE